MKRILTNVPDDEVDQVVEDFESEGFTVTKEQDGESTWKVTATKNDQAAGSQA